MMRTIMFATAAALAMASCDRPANEAEVGNIEANQQAEQAGPPAHHIVAADQISWADGPPSLESGAQSAVLHGDPSKDGLFVMRLKLPAGFRVAPHTHPRPEIVTIVSGAVHIGMGDTADPASAQRLSAGSFFAFDPGLAHYAHVDEETVLQISSTGPWAIEYVNPADDPRQKN